MEQEQIDEIIEKLSCNKVFIDKVAGEAIKRIEAKQAYLDGYRAGYRAKKLAEKSV